LWSLANPRAPAVITELPLPAGLSLAAGVPSVAVSPDGLLVAAAVVAHGTLLWSVANPGRPRFLTDLPNPSAAPAADSPAVAFASAAPGQGSSSRAGAADLLAETVYDGQTSLWQVSATTGGTKQVAVLGGGFTSIAFGSSGTPAADLLTAAGAAHIGLWNVANPSSPTSLTDTVGAMTEAFGAGAYLTGTAISPDGTELAYVSEGALDTNGQLCVLPVSSVAAGAGAAPSCTSTGFGLTTVAYTASGAILSGGTDDEVRLWRNPVPQATGATGGGDGWGVSPDDRTMTTVDVPAGGTLPTAAQVWDITGQDGPRLDATLPVAASFVSYLSATELLTVTSDGTATAWDLTDPRRPVRGVSFGTIPDGSPSTAGNLIAIQGTDGRLHIWRLADVRHVTQVADIPVPGALPGSALITADGKAALAIAATKEEATATIDWWDLTTPSRATPAGTTPIGNVQGAFAVDDTVAIDSLAAGPLHNQGVIDLFDVVSGRPTRPVAVTDTAGNTVALSGDGRLLAATGSGNNTVHLWDVANPLKPVALGTFPAENQVTELEFDSGDDQLAVLNVAGTLQLWDIASPGAPVLTAALGPQGQNDAQVVIAARYLPAAGQRLLVDTVSGIGIIDADPATLAASLCAYSGNSLTPQVWDTYISHVPYQNPCRDR
jgi:WD40 repeat protein